MGELIYSPGLYSDSSSSSPVDTCPRCGGEIYDHEAEPGNLCHDCCAAMARYDQRTVQAVMEELDFQLQKFLADNPRNAIYNELATKFNLV